MEVYYCPVCGKKISEDDVKQGLAVKSAERRVLCKQCFTEVGATAKAAAPKTSAPPRITRAPRPASQPQQLDPARQKVPPIWIGLAVAVCVVAAALFLSLKNGEPPATSRPAEHTPVVSAPPPVQKTPDTAVLPTDPPQSATLDPAAKEKEADAALDAALHADPASRLAALESFLSKYNEAGAAARGRVELRRLKLGEDAASTGTIVLATVDRGDEQWHFYNGSEYPGASGSMERDTTVAKVGTTSLKISADFTKGGAYVGAGLTLTPDLVHLLEAIDFKKVKKLSFWLRSSETTSFTLHLGDSTGQTHLLRLPAKGNGEWEQIEVTSFNTGKFYQKWGGANDGIFHWPLTGAMFCVEKSQIGNFKKSTVWIDQVVIDLLNK